MDSEIASTCSASDLAFRLDDLQVGRTKVCRDDIFYFSLVTFKVEDCLFRVPKHELEEQSHVFRDMFSMPPAEENDVVEGMSDDNPIHLEAINKTEFKLLLQILYLPKAKDISSSLSLKQCTSLLDMSRMWGFEKVRLIAKNHIRNSLWYRIAVVDRIDLAHKYEIEDWYVETYLELATRLEPLSIVDAQKLGLDFSVKMGQVREKVALARPRRKNINVDGAAREAIGVTLIPRRSSGQITVREESPRSEEPSFSAGELRWGQFFASQGISETRASGSGWGF